MSQFWHIFSRSDIGMEMGTGKGYRKPRLGFVKRGQLIPNDWPAIYGISWRNTISLFSLFSYFRVWIYSVHYFFILALFVTVSSFWKSDVWRVEEFAEFYPGLPRIRGPPSAICMGHHSGPNRG